MILFSLSLLRKDEGCPRTPVQARLFLPLLHPMPIKTFCACRCYRSQPFQCGLGPPRIMKYSELSGVRALTLGVLGKCSFCLGTNIWAAVIRPLVFMFHCSCFVPSCLSEILSTAQGFTLSHRPIPSHPASSHPIPATTFSPILRCQA